MRLNRRTFMISGAAPLLWSDEPVPRKSPELEFSLPKKGPVLLSSYRGKVIALEFVLTTCMHCQAAAKVMTKVQERHVGRGFQAFDVAINENADLLVENFAKEHGASFPVGWTSLAQAIAYLGFSGPPMVPQLVIINRKGTIRYQTPRTGDGEAMKEETIERRVRELL